MSKFTTEVRFLCESLTGLTDSVDGSQIDATIDKAIPVIFDKARIKGRCKYFTDEYLEQLYHAILAHYYFDEIGSETYGLWRYRLNTKMSEIIPVYDELYRTVLLDFDILKNVDYSTTANRDKNTDSTENKTKDTDATNTDNNTQDYTRKVDGTRDLATSGTDKRTTTDTGTVKDDGSNSGTTSGSSLDLHSDTPQGGVFVQDVEKHDYLTDARKQTNSGNTSGTDTNTRTLDTTNAVDDATTGTAKETTGTTRADKTTDARTKVVDETVTTATTGKVKTVDDYVEHIVGLKGNTFTNLIKEFRENIVNINVMIIDELADLFMGLWE